MALTANGAVVTELAGTCLCCASGEPLQTGLTHLLKEALHRVNTFTLLILL